MMTWSYRLSVLPVIGRSGRAWENELVDNSQLKRDNSYCVTCGGVAYRVLSDGG